MNKILSWLMSLAFLSALIANPLGLNIFELPKIHYLSIFLALSLITIGIAFIHKEKIELVFNKKVYLILGLWILSLVASTVFSIEPTLSFWGSEDRLQGLFSHLIYIGFFLIFLHLLKDKKSQETILKGIISIGLIAAIHAILQQFGMFTFFSYAMDEFVGRSFAALGHPNMLGQFLILPIWSTAYFITQTNTHKINSQNKTKIIKPVLILILLILLCALLLTHNRATILGIGISAIFAILIYSSKKIKYTTTLVLILAIAAFIFFFAPSLESLTARNLLWQGSLKLLFNHPIFGSGLETFKITFQSVVNPKIFELEQLYYFTDRAHNQWLDLIVMQGFFGATIYATIIGSLFYGFFKNYKTSIKNTLSTFILCALISILISNLFSFDLSVHYLSTTLIFAILINQLFKLKTLKIKVSKTFIPIFLVGLITAGSLISISVRTIYSDVLTAKASKSLAGGLNVKAISTLEDSLENNPRQEDAYVTLIQSKILLATINNDPQLLDQAYELNEKMGIYAGKTFLYYIFKGDINLALGNNINSENAYIEGYKKSPKNPFLIQSWGKKYFMENNYEKSIEKYEEFLSLVPDYWQWKNELESKSFEEKEKYRLFFKSIPNFSNMFLQLSKSYEELGNTEKSNYYKKFI